MELEITQAVKACPFCGASITFRSSFAGWCHFGNIEGDSCFLAGLVITDAIAWNTRTPSPDIARVEALEKAAFELLAKLDEALPAISDSIQIATLHSCPYQGPSIAPEMDALRAVLSIPAPGEGD